MSLDRMQRLQKLLNLCWRVANTYARSCAAATLNENPDAARHFAEASAHHTHRWRRIAKTLDAEMSR